MGLARRSGMPLLLAAPLLAGAYLTLRWLERRRPLRAAVDVPPRMDTIHHAAMRAHTNSNWSSGLTLWDRVHGTLHLDVAQDEITIACPRTPAR